MWAIQLSGAGTAGTGDGAASGLVESASALSVLYQSEPGAEETWAPSPPPKDVTWLVIHRFNRFCFSPYI